MSRESASIAQPPHSQASHAPSASSDTQQGNEAVATIVEDSNNNTSLVDREQPADGSAAEGTNSQHSPSIREIHKNSWLKRMPCVDRWSGRFPKSQKPEKFWVVFCVHDDKEAFLEFYENRRSAYSHIPLSDIPLSKCLHISPTIVAQENDHEFVITLETQVIRLAASTNEQMLEWMDTMRTKLRELGILEPKDNLYSKEPITSRSAMSSADNVSEYPIREEMNRLSMRDPNSPLPPVPGSTLAQTDTAHSSAIPSSTIVYIRNPPILRASNPGPSSSSTSSPTTNSESLAEATHSVPGSVFSFDSVSSDSDPHERVSRSNSLVSQESSSPVPSPTSAEQQVSSALSTPISEQTLYEPLFCSAAPSVSLGIRNPNYENPPPPQSRAVSNRTPALPPRPVNDQRRMSSSVASDIQFAHSAARTSGLSNLAATSDPSLHASSQAAASMSESVTHGVVSFTPAVLLRSQSHQDAAQGISDRSNALPMDEGPPPYNSSGPPIRNSQASTSLSNGAITIDENGKPLSLREVQVQKLQSEIFHKSGVRLVLRKKDCINAIALVECFNCVWVAGWKQKEHPLLHNTFHVGDRIISIAGHRILSVQDAHKAIKHQSSIVEFIVRRVPCGRVLAIKREYEGQDLGILREGGTAEIKEVKANGLVAKHGLPAKAPTLDCNSLCNWFLTEINHRPLNLFFKDNEVHDRLNAVGLDISILVQPTELVKALKKQLKAIRSYKDYIVQ